MNEDEYDYEAEDLEKIEIPDDGEHEYEPEADDLPLEEWPKRKKTAEITFTGTTGRKNTVTAPTELSVPLVDENGTSLPDKPYRIITPGGRILCGFTDSKGVLTEYIDEPGECTIELEDGSELNIETD